MSVVQPIHEIGGLAAQLLLRQINAPQQFVPETHALDTTLVVRQSTRAERE